MIDGWVSFCLLRGAYLFLCTVCNDELRTAFDTQRLSSGLTFQAKRGIGCINHQKLEPAGQYKHGVERSSGSDMALLSRTERELVS